MSNKWTKEQLAAINEKNGNILVSAAAGSGKTAVLVERIIKLITDEKEPVDIDRLLVVTFTKAAAAEMKERIGNAINKQLELNPESTALRKQAVLLNRADIMTIHSFCLHVAMENYNILGIDPAFRVADEAEILLIREEVIDRLFEEKYASDEPEDFLWMVENYSDGTSDKKLRELVLRIYDFIRSFPNEKEWIEKQKAAYNDEKTADIWFSRAEGYIREYIIEAKAITLNALDSAEKYGPDTYIPMLESDIEQYEYIESIPSGEFEKLFNAVKNIEYMALSRKKTDSDNKERVKLLREKAKKLIVKAVEKFIFLSIDEMKDGIKKSGYGICALLDIVNEFSDMFDAEKKERRIADYGDLEHYCLKVLTAEGSTAENPIKSEAAKELSEKYVYVMTDEYQDSNAVQELILTLVSNGKNRFMVGDVKQSIYSFRLADPDIFVDKYNTYEIRNGAENERIDMFMNFRSRKEVLDGINFIFMQLMQKEFGGIAYDKNAMLYNGMEFPEYIGEAKAGGAVELDCIVTNGETSEEENDNDDDLSGFEKEAEFIAERIEGLMYGNDRMEVYDNKLEEYRPLKYSDIAVVMRSMTHGAEMVEIFRQHSIPASADTSTEFLETTEVMTALNFLKLIDNPRQDIPLAAVLRSPVYGFTADELLTIKLDSGEEEYYDCVRRYIESGSDENLRNRLAKFYSNLNKWRDISLYNTINELIWQVFTDTGLYDYAGVMPDGKARQANLLKLVRKASDYDNLSFKGLFDFIRYIEKIDKNKITIDGKTGSDSGNSVQIMTIHKSKGLEFPVVVLAGTSAKFNKRDLSNDIIIHKKFGIGSEFTDTDTRVKYNTLPRAVISQACDDDRAAEEMRVLYVAMTRAKEKLIITGNVKFGPTKAKLWNMANGVEKIEIQPKDIVSAGSYLDWIMMSLIRHRSGKAICDFIGKDQEPSGNGLMYHEAVFDINFIDVGQSTQQIYESEQIYKSAEIDEDKAFIKEQVNSRLSWKYPYEAETAIPGSVTVTDIKKINGEKYPYVVKTPEFYSENKGLSAAEKGTAVHKVIEHLSFDRTYDYAGIKQLVDLCCKKGILSEKERMSVSIKKIEMFTSSELFKRISAAECVFREETFTVAIQPSEIYGDEKCGYMDESIILHGRIDCYFVENGQIVLLDYKTDYVDELSELSERYGVQMRLYKKAAEKVTRMKVKECLIYSVQKGRTIKVL